MPIFTKDGRSVLFVHIPKAAGSTVERVFKASGWTIALRETRKTHPELMPLRRCSPQHYHAALLQELLDLQRFDVVFAVTREPISRFRSEYVMRNARDPRTDADAVDDWAQRVLARRQGNPFVLDNHLRPQHEFVIPGSAMFKVEQGLDQVLRELVERFGLDLDRGKGAPRAMHSLKRAGVSSESVQVSDELLKTLRDLYAEDFAGLGY